MDSQSIALENLPKNEAARIAVERAREIVKFNNEMVNRLKEDSCIPVNEGASDPFYQSETISFEKTYTFSSDKIKSTLSFSDFIKDVFGVH